jgi:hypothetical protein
VPQVAADDAATDVNTDDTNSALVSSTTAAPTSLQHSSQQVRTLSNVNYNTFIESKLVLLLCLHLSLVRGRSGIMRTLIPLIL